MSPTIYVACLAAYNNGKLHGEWIDCDCSVEEILENIQEMLKNSPEPNAEDWAIHDREGWYGISISEYESLETLSDLARSISEHGEAFAHYYNHFGELEGFEDRYMGCYESEADFVYETISQQGTIDKIKEYGLEYYIDWEKMANDWFIDDFYSVQINYQEVYVFNRH